ncbi:MAG: hypothetical protein KME15_15815 [Drouetiella hepatica Uher 2000/2452]|jgi:hypothetical protein|uniref:Uncharacterized protein n=1 Tax=Drouetiella hepatica Uher 2000/2452 TaxID=904376 RepID=A0A951UN96_9CYAN|nr:hypothetical protein [Drouetiella hepatica Uher 2000/2452]
MKIKWGLSAIAGLLLSGSHVPLSSAQMVPAVPPVPTAPWYNCLTREVWTPEKQAWCKKVEALRNAAYTIPQSPSYVLPELIAVKLINGRYEDRAKQISATFVSQQGSIVFGDLNDDGTEDAVSLLSVNTGGSGVFTYLVLSINQNGVLKPMFPVLLGDRIQFKSMAIEPGKIRLTIVTQGANDSMCCPTQEVTKTFDLR